MEAIHVNRREHRERNPLGILRDFYIYVLPAPLKRISRAGYLACTAFVYRLRYPGQDCQCNFCGFTAGQFYPSGYRQGVLYEKRVIGGGFRENARCPKCFSLNRERQVLYVLRNVLSLDDTTSVLHVAPERNLNETIRGSISSRVQECDLLPSAYAWASNIEKQDLTKLTYDAESFDLVLCNHVLEHVPDDRAAMSEIFRVLRPGGHAILQIPYSESIPTTEEDLTITDPEEQLRIFGQRSHVRIYERNDYTQRVESVGFTSRFMGPDEFMEARQFALDPQEGIFLFRRP